MNSDLTFCLYSGLNCSLCDVFRKNLDKRKLSYNLVDIETDPKLQHRYSTRIPVLVAGNTVICEGKYDSGKIDAFFIDRQLTS